MSNLKIKFHHKFCSSENCDVLIIFFGILAFLLVIIVGFILLSRGFDFFKSDLISPLGGHIPTSFPTPPPPQEVTLAFAGEMILARTVAQKINQYRDYKYPFYKVSDVLAAADFAFATLEAPLSGENIPCAYGCLVFVGDAAAIEGIKFSGIDGVSLAANHIMDGELKGLKDTLELLDQNGIFHTGAGINAGEAQKPIFQKLGDTKFAFLAYNDVPPQEYTAGDKKPGLAWLAKEEAVKNIQGAKRQAQVVVVAFHWGQEYTAIPTQRQKEMAHTAIDSGADLVIGDHPHWIQPIEFYQDKLIIYGIGNFVFDQMWSEQTRLGLIVLTTFTGNQLTRVKLLPIKIENFAQPQVIEGKEQEIVLEKVMKISDNQSVEKLKSLE